MNPIEVIFAACAAGVRLGVDGEDLVLDAPAAPPDTVLELLARHKPDIAALLQLGRDGWLAEDWRAFFDERAALGECAGGLPRVQAEARAYACCLAEWLNRNPFRSSPDRCLECGMAEDDDNVLLPFGVEGAGHCWLHSRCWPAWYQRRKTQAVAALAAKGIAPRGNFADDFAKNGGA